MEEYRELQKSGASMSFVQYANEKQSSQPKSYLQFVTDKRTGKPDLHSYGETSIVKKPDAVYYSGNGKYVPANTAAGELNSSTQENRQYQFKHSVDDFNVVESDTLWDKMRHTCKGTLYETNCYALALDMTSFPDGTKLSSDRNDPKYALQPGMLSDKTPEYLYRHGTYLYSKDGTYSELLQAVRNDLDVLGLKLVSYDPQKCDKSSGYAIAIAVGEKGNERNLHFMRSNSNGIWESKDGSHEAKIIESDESPEEIMNDLGYTDFVGAFYITEDSR